MQPQGEVSEPGIGNWIAKPSWTEVVGLVSSCREWEEYIRGADMVILFVKLRNDLPLSVLADKHSIGTSPDSGLHIYFSASFHLEFKTNPSGDKHSQL